MKMIYELAALANFQPQAGSDKKGEDKMKKLIVLLSTLLFIPAFASISIPLEAETWLQTKTANITINVDAATQNQDVLTTQEKIINQLKKLSHVEWHIVSMNRSEGQSGLTHLVWQVQARVPLAEVNTIANKIKSISVSGRQFSLARTDYSPSFLARQQAQAELREKIYEMAKVVLMQANKALPDQPYHIGKINFMPHYTIPFLRPQMMVNQQNTATVSVGNRLMMNAVVELEVNQK